MNTTIINNLKEIINWATTKPDALTKIPGITIAKQKKEEQQKEKEWGNRMIDQVNNGQWTTKLGENLVFEILISNSQPIRSGFAEVYLGLTGSHPCPSGEVPCGHP